MKTVYSGSPDKTEVSGSSPEWPTILYRTKNCHLSSPNIEGQERIMHDSEGNFQSL